MFVSYERSIRKYRTVRLIRSASNLLGKYLGLKYSLSWEMIFAGLRAKYDKGFLWYLLIIIKCGVLKEGEINYFVPT